MKKTGIICRLIALMLVLSLIALPAQATEATDITEPTSTTATVSSDMITITEIFNLTGETEEEEILDADMSVTNGCRGIDGQIPMLAASDPIGNVAAAFLYDYTNDTLIYSQNADDRYYPASLVKIMSGLILAERADLTEKITVRQDVLDTIPANSLGADLLDGEIISMEDLLYCSIVKSANDATAVAADHVLGSQEAFVEEMNRYAKSLGCRNTNFTNVNGLHDPNQYSTARDLGRILAAAAKNEVFMTFFSTVNYTVPATNLSEPRELSSSNYLMNDDLMTIYLDSRVTGGRAGIVETGERNLAVTAEKNDIKLVSIVLGSNSIIADDGYTTMEYGSFKETSQLLDMGFGGHQAVQLFYKDQALKQYPVVNGESDVSTGIIEEIRILLPSGVTYDDLIYLYNEENTIINAPVAKGDPISTIQVWHGEVCLAEADLYALHDVNVATTTAVEEAEIDDSTDGNTILILVAIIVGMFLILLLGRPILFRIIHRRRVRKHRANRRRSR